MTIEIASGLSNKQRHEEVVDASPADSKTVRDGNYVDLSGDPPWIVEASQPEDVPLANVQQMVEFTDKDKEAMERLIQCTDWKVHVDLILETQSSNMFKEHIKENH